MTMFSAQPVLEVQGRRIGKHYPTYFIADIAANHDGDLERAKNLIFMAAEAGADAVKFQHFQASTIVSDHGFKSLTTKLSHQAKWKSSVFDVYQAASVDLEWTASLKKTCENIGITFFTTPYSLELVDYLDDFVPAYKIGSGDITWHEMIEHIASKQKPYFLATGASSLDEVRSAVEIALAINPHFALMQCNTNYTASLDNFRYIQLNVLKTYQAMYPDLLLGLSDHTPGHATVLGAVTLGARLVEKHFTDDTERVGPDHAFSLDPRTWRDMVDRTRELEMALGTGVKKVEDNESQTVILQRRAIRLRRDIDAGEILQKEDFEFLRPCPSDAIPPYLLDKVLGKMLLKAKVRGDHLSNGDYA